MIKERVVYFYAVECANCGERGPEVPMQDGASPYLATITTACDVAKVEGWSIEGNNPMTVFCSICCPA